MKLISLNCPHCGGALNLAENEKQIKCPFCDSNIAIDNETLFDNTEQAGYAFEKGRIKAQQEAINARNAEKQAREEERRRIREKRQAEYAAAKKQRGKNPYLFWWVLGWICYFPIPLTVLIVKSKKLKSIWKAVLIIVMWMSIFLIGILGISSDKKRPQYTYTQNTASAQNYVSENLTSVYNHPIINPMQSSNLSKSPDTHLKPPFQKWFLPS